MFHIILFEPEIPPNTGNVIRLCANNGCVLHLIEPLGFSMNEKALRRAGLDYHDTAKLHIHANAERCFNAIKAMGSRIYALSTKGTTRYTEGRYRDGDAFLFGPETRGLPEEIRNHAEVEEVLTLPMQANNRSLNLSNAVAIVSYEAWRQQDFSGAIDR
ncbi:MAG: tRNA (cytidine(34)-2'-O)-methyltransferase [Gammaproteobacteria bacterium]|nr:tRNA (cytidine(34)-2'-O)-methyltransferase [Gammaproteobacteria bacterium]